MKNTGGAAFPLATGWTETPPLLNGSKITMVKERDPGMTLRDYFAAKAMEGEFAAQDIRHDGRGTGIIQPHNMLACAIRYYEMADAMLEARSFEK